MSDHVIHFAEFEGNVTTRDEKFLVAAGRHLEKNRKQEKKGVGQVVGRGTTSEMVGINRHPGRANLH
jgi:hypothetical protein